MYATYSFFWDVNYSLYTCIHVLLIHMRSLLVFSSHSIQIFTSSVQFYIVSKPQLDAHV